MKKDLPSVCPLCGGENTLEYCKQEVLADLLCFDWECAKCKATGTEEFKLVFIRHKNVEPPFKIYGAIITYYEYFKSLGYRFYNAENKLVCTIEDDDGDKDFDELAKIYGDATDA